jgi:enoyl-CoA hydratase
MVGEDSRETLPVPALADLLIDPSEGWASEAAAWLPLGFIDLTTCAHDARLGSLPPFPLVGFGDSTHPLAKTLDAILEPPISAQALIQQALKAPRAAAAAVQLLRSLEGISAARALPLESFCYGLLQASAEHRHWLTARASPALHLPPGRIAVERHDAELHITIDRPLARNAIDRDLRDQLFDAITIANLDTEIEVVKLRAAGTAFCVGADLAEFGATRDAATAHLIRSRTLPARALEVRADILDVHVQGACVGAGLEMAAFASRLTATPNAWFQLPELAMGLIPGAGGCVSVPRRIGKQRTALMILSGRRINAATALRWRLIDAIETEGR